MNKITKYLLISLAILFLSASFFAVFATDMPVRGKHLEAEISCADCHKTETPEKPALQKTCKECHEGMETGDNLTLESSDGKKYSVNPHNAHTGALRCTLCHNVHAPSVLYCNKECHHSFTIAVP